MNKREISYGVILSLLAQIGGIAVNLICTPVIIRELGQNEYGLYQLVLSVVNYLTLMNFGFNSAYIRYYTIAKSKSEKRLSQVNGMFLTVFMVIAALCMGAGTVLYRHIEILGNQLTASDYATARHLIVYMIINMAISFPNSLFVAYIFANEKFIFNKVVGIAVNILLPLCKIPMILMGYGSVGIVAATLGFTVFQFVLNYWYCRCRLGMRFRFDRFDRSLFWDMIHFTLFIFISDLVDQLNSNVDKLLLGRIMGTVAVAVYSVAYNLKTYYTMLTWIVPEMYIPAANKAVIEEDNMDEANRLFQKIGRINNYLTLLVITGFILYGRCFIELWVGPGYEESYYAMVILMLSGYIPAVQTLGTNIQNAKNMHQMRSVVYLLVACINVVLTIFLIRWFGVIGACIGTLTASLVGTGVFMNIYYHKRIGLNVISFWKEISKWYPASLVLFAAGMVLGHYFSVDSWGTLFLSGLVYSLCYVLLLWKFGLKQEEKSAVQGKIRSVRSRFQ